MKIALHKAELRLCIVIHWYVTSVCYFVHLQNSIFYCICQVKWKKTENYTNPFFDFVQKNGKKLKKVQRNFQKTLAKPKSVWYNTRVAL